VLLLHLRTTIQGPAKEKLLYHFIKIIHISWVVGLARMFGWARPLRFGIRYLGLYNSEMPD
jgi:hypothetical protein